MVLPNLYYRENREFDFVRDDERRKTMFAMMGRLSNEPILQDTQALLNFVDQADATRSSSIAAVGYCMSGPFVLAAAGRYPDRIACAASIYGAIC